MKDSSNITGYDRWSAFYDAYPNPTVAIDDLHLPGFYREWRGLRILELGCGSGRHTVRLAGQGNQVLAIDASAGMLALARQKAGSSQVRFMEADLLALELPPGPAWGPPFDAVFESLVLEHVQELDALCARVSAWLRPGGLFLASEIHPERAAAGVLAHFTDPNGEEVHLASVAHPPGALQAAAAAAGLTCELRRSICGDDALARARPGWDRYLGRPMIEISRFVRR